MTVVGTMVRSSAAACRRVITGAKARKLQEKKAVATLMSIQNLWAAFVAHGLASPEMPGEPYLKRVFGQPVLVAVCLGPAALMVAAILTAPDAKAGKRK